MLAKAAEADGAGRTVAAPAAVELGNVPHVLFVVAPSPCVLVRGSSNRLALYVC